MKWVTYLACNAVKRRKVLSDRGGNCERGRTLNVKFYGVRGSTPCSCESTQRIGGNTACVVINVDDSEPIVLDLGTGLRFWGDDLQQADDGPLKATALVSHLHWDHVQGLPFFVPIHDPESHLTVFGPSQDGASLSDTFDRFLCPPYFPVGLSQLGGSIDFVEAPSEPFVVGRCTVVAKSVPHVGPTLGYRIECDGASVAYVSDHQQPGCGATTVQESVLELCSGADLLIHDAQYTAPEFAERFDWGHCTVEYAVEVAAQAGVKTLALFHHDPNHDDATVEQLSVLAAKASAARGGPEIVTAVEGLSIQLGK